MIERIDIIIIAIFFPVNITCFILTFFKETETIKVLGDWFVMLTHFMIVLYHFSRLGYYGPMLKFQTWNIEAQNVVVSATFFVLVFVTLPEWTYLFMAGTGIFVAAMGSVEVGPFYIYELFCGIIMLGVFVYLIVRTVRPIKIRDNTYIALARGVFF